MNQIIGGSFNASSSTFYSFSNDRAYHTCNKIKRIEKPSHISPGLCGEEYQEKNGINYKDLGDIVTPLFPPTCN